MCGLAYAHNLDGKSVNQLIWKQYIKQQSRGTQGFGLFDGRYTVKAAMEKRIRKHINKKENTTNLMLFHHRYPTSTINVKRAAHPFNTGDFFGNVRYVLVHNGVIRNPKDMKEAHEKLGIEYQSVLNDGTFNDSEALLWDFALAMEGKQDGKLKTYGGIAFICIRMVDNKMDKLYFGRNRGRPLNFDRTDKTVFLSSEGKGDEIDEDKLYTYNYALNRLTTKYFKVPTYDPDYSYTYTAPTRTHNHNYNRPTQPSLPISDSYTDWEDSYWEERYGGGGGWRAGDPWWDANGQPKRVWDEVLGYMVDNPKYKLQSKPQSISSVLKNTFDSEEVTQQDIQKTYWKLMVEAKGKYDVAYWTSVGLYYALEEIGVQRTVKESKEMQVLHEVGELISKDENFTNDTAVHPLWRSGRATKRNVTQHLIGAKV